jgi:hypothetical protein
VFELNEVGMGKEQSLCNEILGSWSGKEERAMCQSSGHNIGFGRAFVTDFACRRGQWSDGRSGSKWPKCLRIAPPNLTLRYTTDRGIDRTKGQETFIGHYLGFQVKTSTTKAGIIVHTSTVLIQRLLSLLRDPHFGGVESQPEEDERAAKAQTLVMSAMSGGQKIESATHNLFGC